MKDIDIVGDIIRKKKSKKDRVNRILWWIELVGIIIVIIIIFYG